MVYVRSGDFNPVLNCGCFTNRKSMLDSGDMTIYKRVRKKCKLKSGEMARILKRAPSTYSEAEHTAVTVRVSDLVAMKELCEERGITLDKFWRMIELSAKYD